MTEFHDEPPPATPSSPLSANQPHRPADDTEEVYYEGSPLLRGAYKNNLPWTAVGLVLIVTPVLISHFIPKHHFPTVATIAMIAAGLAAVCYPPFRALTMRYRVTNYRIDFERGLISKDIDTLELWHVEDLSYHQTVMDRLLGLGTIIVNSHDPTTPILVMHGLPHSRHLFDQLKQRIISVKRQRGVLKLDSGT